MAVLKLTRAVLLVGVGTDELRLYTDLPEATWPFNPLKPAVVQMSIASGMGEAYVKKHFPSLPLAIVSML